MRKFVAPKASVCPGPVGRITAQWGRFGLINWHGYGKDEICLKKRIAGCIEIRKRQSGGRICDRCNGRLHGVAGKIHPFQEVCHFVSPDGKHDVQDFQTGYLLSESGIKTRATLLDCRKVKGRCVSNRLNMVGITEIGICSGIVSNWLGKQGGQCLREGGAKIGVISAAIPGVPTSIYFELREIGKPTDFLCPIGLAAWQRAKPVQIDGLLAFRDEVSVQEFRVTQLIQCIT